MGFTAGILVGLFLGGIIGISITALMVAASCGERGQASWIYLKRG